MDDASSVASSASSAGGPDFNYLLSMSMLSLSREKKEELLKERDNKVSGSLSQSECYSPEPSSPLTSGRETQFSTAGQEGRGLWVRN